MRKISFGTLVFALLAIAALVASIYILSTKEITPRMLFLCGTMVAVALASLIAARYLSKDVGDAIAVTLLAAIAALYAAEYYLAKVSSQVQKITYSANHDTRSILEVIADLRQSGNSGVVPIIYPSAILTRPDIFSGRSLNLEGRQILPLSGISSRSTVLCNESGYWAKYDSDEMGFHNPKGLWKQAVDIAVVGDSFSHGNCVHSGEDWVSILRKRFPRTLNLGMGGNGPLYELATIKEYLTTLKPKIVIWEYFEANDSRIPAELTLAILNRYLNEPDFKQGITLQQGKIDKYLEQLVDNALKVAPVSQLDNKFNLSGFLRLLNLRGILGLQLDTRTPSKDVLSQALAEGNRVVSSWGGKLYFVYLPSAVGLASQNKHFYASREAVIGLANKQNIPVIDLYPRFVSSKDPLSYFPYRGVFHYNAEGYKLVAEEVTEQISRYSDTIPMQVSR